MKMNTDDHDKFLESFNKTQKSMFKTLGVVALIGSAISVGALFGLIYFVFWLLKHFGVIGA